MKLRTGDKVEWKVGIGKKILMQGVVMEEKENGDVDIITHTKDHRPFVVDLLVKRCMLTLI